jgi:hypothetical protein
MSRKYIAGRGYVETSSLLREDVRRLEENDKAAQKNLREVGGKVENLEYSNSRKIIIFISIFQLLNVIPPILQLVGEQNGSSISGIVIAGVNSLVFLCFIPIVKRIDQMVKK